MNKRSGFSLIELIIVVGFILLISGAIMPLLIKKSVEYRINAIAQMIVSDTAQAQQFALSRKDGFSYYGIQIFSGIGGMNSGYKIIRFTPQSVSPPIESNSQYEIVKSPYIADNPLIYDQHLLFNRNIGISKDSEIKLAHDTLIFTPEGSITTDGETLLPDNKNELIISNGSYERKIMFYPLTGKAEIE